MRGPREVCRSVWSGSNNWGSRATRPHRSNNRRCVTVPPISSEFTCLQAHLMAGLNPFRSHTCRERGPCRAWLPSLCHGGREPRGR